MERLESRELLSTTPVVHPMFELGSLVQNPNPPSGAYTPAQIQQAYQFNKVSANGTNETIAIVDAYDDPNIQSDLNTFDGQFGLPSLTITKVNQTGGTSLPSADSTGGWELEESLDVEWAHAMAPGAKILLVEASTPSSNDLLAGVSDAAAHANVVSMSWGTGEFSGESSYDSDFLHSGVAFVASSGDNGAPISWPAASQNVLAVGGTALTLGANNAWSGEAGWSGSGGGPSAYESQPSYQSGVVTATTMRANPDVAYDASPNTGFAVYDSDPYSGTSYGWLTVGGTSAGAPQWAAILAITDQARAATSQPALNGSSAQEVMTTLYKVPGDFHDITSGTSTGSPSYTAKSGYDYVTGLGSPMVNLVIGSLVGNTTTAPDSLVVSVPGTATAGTSFSVTVTADTSGGAVDTGYVGSVHFTSTDSLAVLPGDYTFTAADKGSHTFTVTLNTAGIETITATDTSTSAVVGTSSGIAVSPAAPVNLTATAVSTAQINLTWTASAGATAYLIQRSANGGSSWTQISSVAGGTTSDHDTGLSAGTTYEYRVIATGGNLSSVPSNVATATTTGIGAMVDTIWSNSYTPAENAYSWGSYELGMKFTSTTTGQVTGVRFYKQTWMGGYTHVGHLWSSTGTLLATATFANETTSGWQQVNFASPVSIQANTIYIVSFSTGGGDFGISTGFFTNGGVTSGPLQALSNRMPGGDGVYQAAGDFPNVSGSGMNFWVDVAFAPSTSPAVRTSSASSGIATTRQWGAFAATTAPATPAVTSSSAGSSRMTSAPTAQPAATGRISRTFRPTITQSRPPIWWGLKGGSTLA